MTPRPRQRLTDDQVQRIVTVVLAGVAIALTGVYFAVEWVR